MSLLRILTEKPWEVVGVEEDDTRSSASLRSRAPQWLALWVYLGVVTILFTLLIAAYVLRAGDFGASGDAVTLPELEWWAISLAYLCGVPPAKDWVPTPEPFLLWINTAVLIASSVAWQWARNGAKTGDELQARHGLIIGGGLALVFLAGQLAVWRELVAAGYHLTSNPANSFFFLLTAVHGIHLIGGLVVWMRTVKRASAGASTADIDLNVALCTRYWHFLLIVWIVTFALLLMS